jgi:predicted XRE-type DNA-binding protein
MDSNEYYTPNPTDDPSEESNAPEKALTASQHRARASDILMLWLENNMMTFNQAAESLGINRMTLSLVIAAAPIPAKAALKLANKIPELDPHMEGVYNG